MSPKDYHLDKFHILSSTESVIEEMLRICNGMKPELLFQKTDNWSVAENLEHIRLSFKGSLRGLFLPKIFIRLKFGKPEHESMPYEQLEEEYAQKLEAGAKASKPYLPVLDTSKISKERLIDTFNASTTRYLNEVKYYWEEEQLDHYQFPHPILGMLTARELLYFNLFHCWHHFRTMRHIKEKSY
jgi:hypothetical protein